MQVHPQTHAQQVSNFAFTLSVQALGLSNESLRVSLAAQLNSVAAIHHPPFNASFTLQGLSLIVGVDSIKARATPCQNRFATSHVPKPSSVDMFKQALLVSVVPCPMEKHEYY